MKAATEANGGIFTIWITRPFTPAQVRQAIVDSQCSGVLVEGEIPAENAPGVPKPEAVNWVDLVLELAPFNIPKGVVTNFAPFVHHNGTPWPEKARPLIEAGWSCHTECYDMVTAGPPQGWPDQRHFFATQLGWAVTQPVLGVYSPPNGGGSLEAFPTRSNYGNWSVWDAGELF